MLLQSEEFTYPHVWRDGVVSTGTGPRVELTDVCFYFSCFSQLDKARKSSHDKVDHALDFG